MKTIKKIKHNKNSKKNFKKNFKKNSKKNTKNFYSGAGNFLNQLSKQVIQVPTTKNYSVGLGFSSQKPVNQNIKIIFNYPQPNQVDITTMSPTKILSSNLFIKEPYIYFSLPGKYLIVMYREQIKENKSIISLFFLVGYLNNQMKIDAQKKIFFYNEPKFKPGKIKKLAIKIYKYPVNDNTENFVKINNINNKKEAYKEFNVYLNANKLQTVNTFILNIKGE